LRRLGCQTRCLESVTQNDSNEARHKGKEFIAVPPTKLSAINSSGTRSKAGLFIPKVMPGLPGEF